MTIRALTNARVYSLSADAIGIVLKDQPEVTLGWREPWELRTAQLLSCDRYSQICASS